MFNRSSRNSVIVFLLLILSVISLDPSFSFADTVQKEIPQQALNEIPEYRLLINDKPIDKDIGLTSILIVFEINKPSSAELIIQLAENLSPQVTSYFKEKNAKIEIQFGNNNDLKTVFIGHLISQEISQTSDEPYQLILHLMNNQISNPPSPVRSPVIILQYGSNVTGFKISMNKNLDIEGFVSIAGINEPLLGKNVQLDGFSSGFNRIVKVTRVEHLLDKKGWFTTVKIVN